MTWTIESFVDERLDGLWRSRVSICGEPAWFECRSVQTSVKGEAIGSAVLIPALLQGMQLHIRNPVCAQWKENVLKLADILTESWGLKSEFPLTGETVVREATEGRLRGQFFSGGVDSFYELLTAKSAPEALISLHGLDMHFEDSKRFAHLKQAVMDICAQRNLEAVFLKTNVKENSVIGGVSWDDAHGGVLAAIGHILSNRFHTVVIPPSWGAEFLALPLGITLENRSSLVVKKSCG